MDDKNNIGELIAQARKRKKLTQGELAKLLMVTDKAVSNWETGKNYPDIAVLKNISKYLDIDLLSIYLEKDKRKSKKVFNVIISLLIIVSIFFLGYFAIYYFNNKDSISYYKISIDDSSYLLNGGSIIIGNNKVIMNLGDIDGIPSNNYDLTLSYTKNKKTVEIISKYGYDYLLLEDSINGEFCGKDIVNNINNLNVTISFFDDDNRRFNETFKLKVEKVISNNKLFYKKEEVSKNIMINDRVKILLHNVGYKKIDNNKYSKEVVKTDEKISLIYDFNKNIYYMYSFKDDISRVGAYSIKDNRLDYVIKYKDYVIEEFSYDKKVTCHLGKCEEADVMIKDFFEHYNLVK